MEERNHQPAINEAGLIGSTRQDLAAHVRDIPSRALEGLRVIRDDYGTGRLQLGPAGLAYSLDGQAARALLHRHMISKGYSVKPRELKDAIDSLLAYSQITTDVSPVWYRYAAVGDAIEIDLGDEHLLRVRVSAGKVEVVEPTAAAVFYRRATMMPLPIPAEDGDLSLLDAHWNLNDVDKMLVRGWVTYVMAHPKRPGSVYPILGLIGPEGSGKSVLSKQIQFLLDPTSVGARAFPKSERDLAVMAQNSHVLVFDNLRRISPHLSDILCISCTGGSFETRKLYSDSDTVAHRLHVALLLNGIHSFVNQQDLAQRCLRIDVPSLEGRPRRSETEILDAFQTDWPVIFRGLLNKIAAILTQLPLVKARDPERLVSFSTWLAAMERVDGVSEGVYQAAYSKCVRDVMQEGLWDDPVAAAVMDLIDGERTGQWRGTPADLLQELDALVGRRARTAMEWPRNEISLGKRLRALEAGLAREGIVVRMGRSRRRWVSIVGQGGAPHV